MTFTPKDIHRFWSKVNKTENENTCWEWQASTFRNGYGHFFINGKMASSHRVAWLMTYGAIPETMYICHRCDNRKCCNPNHLFLGTHAENQRDMAMKHRSPHGEKHKNAKLTAEQVENMRMLYRSGGITYRELAAKFGMSVGHTWVIVNYKQWKG